MLRPIVLMVCLFAAPALAHSEEPAPASVTAPAPGLAGVWFLNAKASDDVEPLLAALGRSSMERAMAKWVTHALTPNWRMSKLRQLRRFSAKSRRY